MTDSDPGLFRLNVFLLEWLRPLEAEYSATLSQESPGAATLRPQTTKSQLLNLLIVEGHKWLEIGQNVGYFAAESNSSTGTSPEPTLTPKLAWIVGLIRSSTLPVGMGVADFAKALDEVREELTNDRRELLRLLLVESDSEWQHQLDLVRSFALSRSIQTGDHIPPKVLQDIGWALSLQEEEVGAESTGHLLSLPAAWRVGGLSVGASIDDTVRDRIDELLDAQELIASWLAESVLADVTESQEGPHQRRTQRSQEQTQASPPVTNRVGPLTAGRMAADPWPAVGRMVGRTAELALLRRRLVELRAIGSGGLVLVAGEAGVGKSRLVRELAAEARQAGMLVLVGRAVSDGRPYRPLVEALSGALRDRGVPDDEALRPYLPVLATVLPDAAVPGGRVDPRDGAVLGEAMLRLVIALGHRSADVPSIGILLVLEDLHWVDPDTLDALIYLAHAAESSPLLLLGTSRAEVALPKPLLELAAATQATALLLERLDADEVRELVEARLSGRPSEEVVAFVQSNGDGLPLLIEELLTSLRSVGVLDSAGQLLEPLTLAVPRTFAATVRLRIRELDPAAQRTIEAAAVLGRRFDWSLLPEITGRTRTEVLEHLRSAILGGLINPVGGHTFAFRHALTGEVIRDDLLPPERRALAHVAAEIVERRGPEAYVLAAGLRAAAGEDQRAAELSGTAGKEAARQGALATADMLLSRAAELATAPELKTQSERDLLTVLAGKGDAERALALGERLLRDGDESVRMVLAEVAADAERWDIAAVHLSGVSESDPHSQARVAVLDARMAYARGEPELARAMASAALATARSWALWSIACQALEVIGRVARINNAAGARDAFVAAETLAREHNLPVSRISALHELGTVELLQNGSIDQLKRARQLAEEVGVLGLAAIIDLQIAVGLLHRDPALSLEQVRRSADLARRLRADRLYATAICFQAVAHAHLGDRELAERYTIQALASAPDDLDINAAVWGQIRAYEALVADDLSTLQETLDKAADYLRRDPTTAPSPVRGLWALVRTLAGKDADAAMAEARPSSVNWENAALLGYADAVAAGRRGRRPEAGGKLATADQAMAALPWWRHRIRLLVADSALSDGWGDPIGWAREALPVFAGRGEIHLASRCREVLRRAGAPVPRPGRGDTPVPTALREIGVTSREVDVLRLMGEGLTNTAIAQRLVLSPRTIETHIANLVAKTGVRNRAGLVALARTRARS